MKAFRARAFLAYCYLSVVRHSKVLWENVKYCDSFVTEFVTIAAGRLISCLVCDLALYSLIPHFQCVLSPGFLPSPCIGSCYHYFKTITSSCHRIDNYEGQLRFV